MRSQAEYVDRWGRLRRIKHPELSATVEQVRFAFEIGAVVPDGATLGEVNALIYDHLGGSVYPPNDEARAAGFEHASIERLRECVPDYISPEELAERRRLGFERWRRRYIAERERDDLLLVNEHIGALVRLYHDQSDAGWSIEELRIEFPDMKLKEVRRLLDVCESEGIVVRTVERDGRTARRVWRFVEMVRRFDPLFILRQLDERQSIDEFVDDA